MIRSTDKFKVDSKVAKDIKNNKFYKILNVTREGIEVEDYADNGVEIKVLLKWKQIY